MNLDELATEEACKVYLSELKWKFGFKCIKCENSSYYRLSKNEMYSSRKCKNCSYIESPTTNTIFANIKFKLVIAFKLYEKVRNNFNIKISELSKVFKIRRQTISNFKKKVLLNGGKILINDYQVVPDLNYCIELIIELKKNELYTQRFRIFLSNSYFNEDEGLLRMFDAIETSMENVEITERQKWFLYGKAINDESIEYSTFDDDGKVHKKELYRKFTALTFLIEDFLVIEEIRKRKSEEKRNYVTSIGAKITKLRYAVFLKNGYLNLLDNALQNDEIQLHKQEKLQRISFNYFDLKHFIELMKIRMLSKQKKIITNEIDFNELILNLDLANIMRKNRIALEFYKSGLESNEAFKFLLQSLKIQKKIERFYGKTKLKNSIGELIKFTRVISNLLDSTKDPMERFRHFEMLFPILTENYFRLSRDQLAEAIKICIDYCRVLLIRAIISYKDLDKLLGIIVKSGVMDEVGFISNSNLKYFVLIYCKVGKFPEAKKLLDEKIHFINENDHDNVLNFNREVIRFYENRSNMDKREIIESQFEWNKLGLGYKIGWFMLQIKGRYDTDTAFDKVTINLFEKFLYFIQQKNENTIKTTDRLACLNFTEILIQLYYIKWHEKLDYSLTWSLEKVERKRTKRMNSILQFQDIEYLKKVLIQQEYNTDKFWLTEEIVNVELIELKKMIISDGGEKVLTSEKLENFMVFINNESNSKLFDLFNKKITKPSYLIDIKDEILKKKNIDAKELCNFLTESST